MKSIIVKHWADVPKNYTGCVEHISGTQAWFKNGKLHREDGPAIIWYNGEQDWYKNGPAVIYSNDTQEWYLNGEEYTKENYYKELYKHGIITEQELFIELL